MSTPSCRQMHPCRDDLRPFAAILRHIAPQSVSQKPHLRESWCRRSAARAFLSRLTAGLRPRLTPVPPATAGWRDQGPTAFLLAWAGKFAAESGVLAAIQVLNSFVSGHGFTGCGKSRTARVLCQGTTSVVPISRLFLLSGAGFSPRGTCFSDFFRSLFSRAARSLTRNWASAPVQTGAEAQALCRRQLGTTEGRALIQSRMANANAGLWEGRVAVRASVRGRKIAAKSGTASYGFQPNYHVCNILPGKQLIIPRRDSISHFISATYVLAANAPSNLTPYSAIFCRPVFANQQLASLHHKIFKTGSLKVNHFNILQIHVCNLLKPNILFFTFFLR
jgi:hypothetical protein